MKMFSFYVIYLRNDNIIYELIKPKRNCEKRINN